jgi:cytochrome c-type biogenesis protein CcmH/NrfG
MEETRGPARLDERRVAALVFGVDAAALGALRAGVYVLRAVVDTTGERGMWNGRAASRPITLRLGAAPAREAAAAQRARLRQSAAFYLADAQFAEAESRARRVIVADASDIEAWVLLGDALDGSSRPQDALAAFRSALKLANAAPGDREPPAYIEQRIFEIQASLRR